MSFIIIFVFELMQTNMEMTKFFQVCIDIKDKFWSLEAVFTFYSSCFELFLKTPRFVKEFESRYDCSEIIIPLHEILLEALSKIIGYEYTAFDPWRHCNIYDHEIEVLNPEYGKLIFPSLINTYRISVSLGTTVLCVLVMLGVSNNWIQEKGMHFINKLRFRRAHISRDGYTLTQAISRGILGVNKRFREMSRQLLLDKPYVMNMHHYSVQPPKKAKSRHQNATEQSITKKFDMRHDISLHYQIPLCVYMDKYKP